MKSYSSDLSLQAVAEVFHLSPAYISNAFKAENKINFLDYVNSVRIEKAKYLLVHSSLSINAVCEKVGFSTYTSFARVFKTLVGMSAKEYRSSTKNS